MLLVSMASPRRKYRKLQIKPDAYRVGETTTPERAAKLGGVVERPLAYANTGRIVHRRQEVRIECFFPADDRSDALFKSLAARS